jgi:uncharacterized surface protein with fasciclin (FAS1) repeats
MKVNRRTLLCGAIASAAVPLLSACGGGHENEAPGDIVAVASANADFSILVEAITAAGLVNTLKGAGPFTVFAPTNAAFAALLSELGLTKEALLANTTLLTAVLTYHVLSAKVDSTAVAGQLGLPVATVQGGILKVERQGSTLQITDGRNRTSTVTATDTLASNGVIHTINRVILPADKNIVQTAQSLSDFSILVEAVVAANLAATLSGSGPFTVFAPTNAAFAALLTELNLSKEALLADTALLTRVLTYHVLPSRVLKAQVPVGAAITTVEGGTFTVNSNLAITDQRNRPSQIGATDVFTSNGVIHVIDRVLLPAA